jgi:glycosyltransferase involved in cell wall biosynthesis
MRVLFLNPSAELGGAERCLLDLTASICAREPDVALGLIATGDGPLIDAAKTAGVTATVLPFGRPLAEIGDSSLRAADLRAIADFARRSLEASVAAVEYGARLRAEIARFAPTVIHSNGAKMHLFGAAAHGAVPLVWHIHDFLGARRVVSRAMKAVSWRASAAIANSNAVARDAGRLFPRLPTTVVYNACDVERFAPTGAIADLDALAGVAPPPGPCVRMGLVATYARWKGHDVFLQAAQRFVASPAPNTRFYVVGGPIYETRASQFAVDELRAMTRTLGIEGHVAFVPFQTRIDEVYRALDVVVHASSRPEPFGLTIAEAMASGRAVIVSGEGGAAELFEHGADAIGVPSGDPQRLALAMGDLARDAARRDALGRAARASAVGRFSRARYADQIVGVYRRVTLGSP